MSTGDDPERADLLAAWVSGWATSRRVARPVACAGGLRVDTRSPTERVRYVFFGLDAAAIREVALAEVKSGAAIKVCASVGELAALLPRRWRLHEQRHLMSAELGVVARAGEGAPPDGYDLAPAMDGQVALVSVRDRQGEIVASGRAAIAPPYAVVDDVATSGAHRRRGLGSLVMRSLNRIALEHGAGTGLLVATPDGRMLYSANGWQVRAPYASAIST